MEEDYEKLNKEASNLYEKQKITIEEEEKKEKERELAKQQENNNTNIPSSSNESSSMRDQVVAFALKYVGNKYVWGGNSLTNGIDCSGFTQQVYKHFNITIPRTTYTQVNAGKEISFDQLKKGDLVFYRGYNPAHVSIYIGGGKIVHAKSKRYGIVIENMNYGKPTRAVSFIND